MIFGRIVYSLVTILVLKLQGNPVLQFQAGRLRQQGKLLDLVDKKLGSRFDNKQALTLLHLAMECISQSPTLRPSMSEVVTKLSDIKASASSSSSEVV